MKNKFLKVIMISVLSLVMLSSCSLIDKIVNKNTEPIQNSNTYGESISYDEVNNYLVTLVYDNENGNKYVEVKKNGYLAEPGKPEKQFATFLGWYIDSTRFDFTKPITSNYVITAKWDVDYKALTNEISTNIIKANVTIYGEFTTVFGNGIISQGSGVIYKEEVISGNTYYYALTNNHVVYCPQNYTRKVYSVEDYLGNKYQGTVKSASANYDLATIMFSKNAKSPLKVLKLGKNNCQIGTNIISLGQPEGQKNTITYGNIKDYSIITLDDNNKNESNVTFNVIGHDAPMNEGSSGGALLDTSFTIVGINYAGGTDSVGNFLKGYAVPIEKVNQFLLGVTI